MKSCTTLLVGVIIGIIPFFLFPRLISAYFSFSDEFNLSIDSSWNIDPEEVPYANIISNSFLKLTSISTTKFPYLWKEIPDKENIEFEIRFRFSGSPNYGAGIILSDTLIPNEVTYPIEWNDIVYIVFPNPTTGLGINTIVCPEDNIGCVENQFNNSVYVGLSDVWYTLKIEKSGNVYILFVDGNQVYKSVQTNKKIRYIWLGQPEKTGAVVWPTIDIDYIRITEKVIDTPSIIIPGLGASWNVGAILSGNDEGSWQIPGFVKNYEGLINSFINAGYIDSGLNKNLYVFPYDWRRPLNVLASRLNDFIDSNIPDDEQVNLIGHSMGGLVARSYAQIYGTEKVNKILTVGSPNMGTAKAYGVWEGALIFNDTWWSRVALELTTRFGVIAGESNIQTVQRTVPSLKDLLPTYPFLVFDGNPPVSLTSGNSNTFLGDLNGSFSNIDSKTTTIYSSDFLTNSLIRVIPHSSGDLGTWIDGKPTSDPFIADNGDGTVTDFSAIGPFSNVLQGSGGHGDLVTSVNNVQNIFSVLGLDETKALSGINDGEDKVFVAVLRSPGTIEVCNELLVCNDELGLYFPDEKLFLLPSYQDQNLVIRITESGEIGTYKLHLGNITDIARWTVVDGSLLHSGQVDRYDIISSNQGLSATLFDDIPPSTPTITGFKNPAFSCGSITNSKYLTVDWTDSIDNYGLAGYEYYVDYPLSSGLGRDIWNPSILWTNSENYGYLNEGVHFIKVRAKDLAGNYSDWSNVCEITYDSIKPTLMSKTIFSDWYKVAQTSTFKYTDTHLRSDYEEPRCVISTEGIAQTCTITPNICDTAGNCNTDTQVSNGANIDMTPPKAPRIFAYDWNQRVWIGWLPIKGAKKYRIYFGTKPSELINLVETYNSYWYSNILPQGKYYFSVTAIDKAGNESLKSNIEFVKIQKMWWSWGR